MSLLTNEQITELVGLASNQSTSKDLHDEFCEWNEKQTGIQWNIDWKNAPKTANRAVYRLHWVSGCTQSELWTASEDAITFERPKPIITPHPHAEMMAKYAEVATRRVDPWVEFNITLDEDDDHWSNCEAEIRFLVDGRRYRYIGETK